jgi:hypothetical protein
MAEKVAAMPPTRAMRRMARFRNSFLFGVKWRTLEMAGGEGILQIGVSYSEKVGGFSLVPAIEPPCFLWPAKRKRLNTVGNTSAIIVMVEPPTRSSSTPKLGTVSAIKTTVAIMALRERTRCRPKSEKGREIGKIVKGRDPGISGAILRAPG